MRAVGGFLRPTAHEQTGREKSQNYFFYHFLLLFFLISQPSNTQFVAVFAGDYDFVGGGLDGFAETQSEAFSSRVEQAVVVKFACRIDYIFADCGVVFYVVVE